LKSFLASKGNVRGVEWILMGVPLDLTVSRLPGSRKGPEAIRVESIHLETYSMDAERDLEDISFHDVGDIVLEGKDVRESLEVIEAVANRFLAMGKKLFTFGGEHLVTLPLVKAASKLHPDIKVLHFDAHAGYRQKLLRPCQASVAGYWRYIESKSYGAIRRGGPFGSDDPSANENQALRA